MERELGMSAPSLAILMSHPSNLDGPLFSKIAASAPFDLTVYYLETDQIAEKVDPELGFSPNWDIPVVSGYRSMLCPRGFIRRVRFLWRECFAGAKYGLVIVPGYNRLDVALLAQYSRRQALGMRLDAVSIYPEPPCKRRLKRMALKQVLRRYAVFHPVGSLTERFLQELGVRSTQMSRFPYAADNGYLSTRAERFRREREGLLAELGIQAGTFVVLGVLKFVPRENPMELLRGFCSFRKRFPDSALILVGTGPLEGEIRECLGAMNLSEAARLVGYARYSDLPQWDGISNVFVHPAAAEPGGVSVNEAMACGLPVVASDRVGASHDLVIEGLNGFCYPSGDSEALADCLGKIASRPEQGREMGKWSQRIAHRWSHEESIASLNAMLHKIVGMSSACPASAASST